MYISEMIKSLSLILDKEGDLEVRLVCDHGQVWMEAGHVGITHIEEETFMAEDVSEEDLEDYPDAVKVCEIQAF
jgi:hypothetical protein